MLQSIYAQIALVLYVLTCAVAFAWGGRTERIGAAIIAFGILATPIIQDRRWDHVDLGLLGIDIVQMLAFVVLAFISARLWAVSAAALMVLVVMVHLATLFQGAGQIFPYISAFNAVGYLVLVCLIVGVIQSRKRVPAAAASGPWG